MRDVPDLRPLELTLGESTPGKSTLARASALGESEFLAMVASPAELPTFEPSVCRTACSRAASPTAYTDMRGSAEALSDGDVYYTPVATPIDSDADVVHLSGRPVNHRR